MPLIRIVQKNKPTNYLNHISSSQLIQKITENLAIFRDDQFPELGGGNKARKMLSLHSKLKSNKFNAIVTTGGVQSNHCRAVALYCTKYNISCSLIIHGGKARLLNESGNAKLIRETRANTIFCSPKEISKNMDVAMDKYHSLGYNPYYLRGGGHTLEGSMCYIKVMEEIIQNSDYIPDYIFIASGTGSTQAGILAGIAKLNLKTKVIGISIAREAKRVQNSISILLDQICLNCGIDNTVEEIIVDDSFLFGGYEQYNSDIECLVQSTIINKGIILDNTYTGKAYYGMNELIKTQNIKGKILFWNTGGLFNYMAK